ncbi:hypothetical protein BS47DRAFT_1387079 [Hydnum rufescens UP504]|uniref:BTB domain-containing protein n=1 Tax=Hydnum rufescens UP504 TaxID=1448309 RepID=A0A9P6BAV2_9AGAM|nr:hypothetical protein BS47DRAFT_1387079 [Hydnum rufescens UP504]
MPKSRMRHSGLAIALPPPISVPIPEPPPMSSGTASNSDGFTTEPNTPSPAQSLALLPKPQGILSFPDGDLILQSNEGDDFGVHLDVLQSVSSYFDEDGEFAKPPQSPGPDIHTRRINLSTGTLDLLLRFLYPSRHPPSIDSTERAITLMQAAADLKIECSWIDKGITSYLSSVPHPLRAWAIATRFGYKAARREAARRFFETNEDFYDDVPVELEHVSAKQFMELQRAKARAVAMARDAINKVEWGCDGCWQSWNVNLNDGRPWKSQFLRRVSELNPFAYDATSEVTFELSMVRGECGHCPKSFVSEEAKDARRILRAQLDEILRNIK